MDAHSENSPSSKSQAPAESIDTDIWAADTIYKRFLLWN